MINNRDEDMQVLKDKQPPNNVLLHQSEGIENCIMVKMCGIDSTNCKKEGVAYNQLHLRITMQVSFLFSGLYKIDRKGTASCMKFLAGI